VNFYPRFAGPFFSLPPADQISMCEASPLCMGVAAWAFSVAGCNVEPVTCCFDCVDELAARARAQQLPIEVVRLQPDLCQACGRHVGEQRHMIDRIAVGAKLTHYAQQVGPFCGPPCGMRWTAARRREGVS
jgi:hypothetical protein